MLHVFRFDAAYDPNREGKSFMKIRGIANVSVLSFRS